MARSRRHTVIRVVQIAGASLVVLDVLLYFFMYRYTQSMLFTEQQQFADLRGRILDDESRIGRLNQFLAGLPAAGERLASFEKDHAPARRQAYSQAAKMLRVLAEKSGAQLGSVAYKRDDKSSGPLLRLGLMINVEGSFPALMKFAHGLETAQDLVVIRGFNIAETDNRVLDLRLAADMYLTP